MELLLVIVISCALGPLALRFGQDSQDRLRSREESAAACGMAWDKSSTCPLTLTTSLGD